MEKIYLKFIIYDLVTGNYLCFLISGFNIQLINLILYVGRRGDIHGKKGYSYFNISSLQRMRRVSDSLVERRKKLIEKFADKFSTLSFVLIPMEASRLNLLFFSHSFRLYICSTERFLFSELSSAREKMEEYNLWVLNFHQVKENYYL